VVIAPGEFFLAPAAMQNRDVRAAADNTSLLQVTMRAGAR
jgi:hypothetical protein